MAGLTPGKIIYPTPQITTGDYTTVNDSTQQNYPLGGYYLGFDSGNRPVVIQYVQFAPATTVTQVAGSPMYYTDSTHTKVTNVAAGAVSYTASTNGAAFSAAGILPATGKTATYYIWIVKCGYFASLPIASASPTLGSLLVLSNAVATAPTDSQFTVVAAGAVPTPTNWMGTLYGVAEALGTSVTTIAGWVRSLDALL